MATEAVSVSWRRSINPFIQDVEVIREGDKNGYGGVFRIVLKGGREVCAIALPHYNSSRTGPTWAYLVDCQGWTLIDAGSQGAQEALEKGLDTLGRKVTDLERVVITHGHQDHDGNTYDLLKASGAELWTHEMYFHFLPYNHNERGLDTASPLHRVIAESRKREEEWRNLSANASAHQHWTDHDRRYQEGRRRIALGEVPAHPIRDGEALGEMRFHYTPGHAIDELCIALDGVVFTGDHVLPQISPHPTFIQTFPEALQYTLPLEHQRPEEHYGLSCYLRSLGKVLALSIDTTVFPAHRLYNHDRLHLRNLHRAREIVRHHVKRLERSLEAIDEGSDTVEAITGNIFPARKLSGGGMLSAISEVVSHLELLADSGDIQVSEDGAVKRTGTHRFYQEIEAMTGHPIG
ncbi:MAG: MBL fold metallo-hydrolase [Chloroflexi bacterium]|nr:MBL fold metallo-hydrolase [Chloroflexota bacterium]